MWADRQYRREVQEFGGLSHPHPTHFDPSVGHEWAIEKASAPIRSASRDTAEQVHRDRTLDTTVSSATVARCTYFITSKLNSLNRGPFSATPKDSKNGHNGAGFEERDKTRGPHYRKHDRPGPRGSRSSAFWVKRNTHSAESLPFEESGSTHLHNKLLDICHDNCARRFHTITHGIYDFLHCLQSTDAIQYLCASLIQLPVFTPFRVQHDHPSLSGRDLDMRRNPVITLHALPSVSLVLRTAAGTYGSASPEPSQATAPTRRAAPLPPRCHVHLPVRRHEQTAPENQ